MDYVRNVETEQRVPEESNLGSNILLTAGHSRRTPFASTGKREGEDVESMLNMLERGAFLNNKGTFTNSDGHTGPCRRPPIARDQIIETRRGRKLSLNEVSGSPMKQATFKDVAV